MIKTKAKAKKVIDIQEICAQLCGTIGASDTHLIDEDDDDDDDVNDQDVYMYPIDMHPNEWDAYRYAICALKAIEWERQQYENIVGNKRKTWESSRLTGALTMMGKSQSMWHSNQSPLIAHSLYKSFAARQKNVKYIFNGGSIKETMRYLIKKFFIYESVIP